MFGRKKKPEPAPRKPLQDPVEGISDGLEMLKAHAGDYHFMTVDDGQPDSLRYLQFLIFPENMEVYGEVNVTEVGADKRDILAAEGWKPGEPNWNRTWPGSTSSRAIATVAVATLQKLYGDDFTFYMKVVIE